MPLSLCVARPIHAKYTQWEQVHMTAATLTNLNSPWQRYTMRLCITYQHQMN